MVSYLDSENMSETETKTWWRWQWKWDELDWQSDHCELPWQWKYESVWELKCDEIDSENTVSLSDSKIIVSYASKHEWAW